MMIQIIIQNSTNNNTNKIPKHNFLKHTKNLFGRMAQANS